MRIYKKHLTARFFFILLLVFILGAAAHANQRINGTQPDPDNAYSAYGKDILGSSVQKAVHQMKGTALFNPDLVSDLYAAHDNKPLWLSRFSKGQLKATLAVFRDSWTHGLHPENYHVETISNLVDNLEGQGHKQKARLEVLLSDAAVRYVQDMTGMRVLTQDLFDEDAYWRAPLEASQIFEALASARNPARHLNSYAPSGAFYEAMRNELISLVGRLPDDEGEILIKLDRPYFFPGDAHPGIKDLRKRLNVSFETSPDRPAFEANIYDDELSAAVIRFQKENRLTADGVLGPNTVRALNFTTRDKIDQLIANMERARWMEPSLPDKYVLVNIPSQQLWAVDDGAIKHHMNVIVGHPTRRTKIFKTEINGIRFNPEWNVPLSIKMRDFLPKLKEDPYALTEKGIEFMRGYGHNAVTIDPGTIDWKTVGWRKMGKIRMVQTPGDHNALGRIRVLMPNAFNMYLHDTNDKELFDKDMRALSSGCIRMAAPQEMARFVLEGVSGWSPQSMDEALSTLETEEVYIDRKIPVFIVYQSVWLADNGDLIYGPDIYNRDRDLIDSLKDLHAYYVPHSDDGSVPDGSTDLASARLMP